MLGLSNITPAAAEAPEHVRYTPSPVWYGTLGRLLMAMERRRTRDDLRTINKRGFRDIGLTGEAGTSYVSPELLRDFARPTAF